VTQNKENREARIKKPDIKTIKTKTKKEKTEGKRK
jgi:hypothetical protein